jgi:predicted Fe-Mo cluster-binding NifX family protein
MKIAAVSDDGVTLSAHFGRAPLFVVVTVEDGRIVSQEIREKFTSPHSREQRGLGQGMGRHLGGSCGASQSRHARMVGAISDCEVLLARGMGAGAYQHLLEAGIRPILTDLARIDDAVQAYLEGRLPDSPDLLCSKPDSREE